MNHRKLKELLGAWGLAFAVGAAASFLGTWLAKRFPTFDAFPLFLLLTGAFVLACVANRTAARIFARSHFSISPAERRTIMEAFEQECSKDLPAVLRRFDGMEATPIFLLIVYFLLTLSVIVTGSFCSLYAAGISFYRLAAALISFFGGVFLLYMPLLRLFALIPHKLNQDALVSPQELPLLHQMAKEAAEVAGIRGKIRIEIDRDCDCGVNRIRGTYVVFLGTRLLAVLNREELKQLMLMEFDNFSRPSLTRQVLRKYRLGMLGTADIRRETFAFDLFFSYADAYMEWEYEQYALAMRRYMNGLAYERVRAVGNPEAAVSALAKKRFWAYFLFEYIHHVDLNFFSEPEPPTHFEMDTVMAFRAACQKRERVWLSFLEQTLRKDEDRTQPFSEVRVLLGFDRALTKLPCELLNWASPYGNEIMTVVGDLADRRVQATWNRQNYEKAREREYLEPLRTVEAYEASPEGYSTPELSPVINAYRELGRITEAEAICDSILESETNRFARAHAIYFKGMCMLHRYETEGIDLIYQAIDLNKNYMKDGFEMVADYCALCGLADEYADCLRRSDIQTSAHAYNQEGASYLVATDHVEREEALGEMLPEILSYMEQVAEGCIREIYLVRKVISEEFFTSVFVINFDYGVSDEQMRKTYSAIFNYLDAYPVDWQFSLFVYDKETERAVKLVKGSLVWEKK